MPNEVAVTIGVPTIEDTPEDGVETDAVKMAANQEKEEDMKELDQCLAGIEDFCGERTREWIRRRKRRKRRRRRRRRKTDEEEEEEEREEEEKEDNKVKVEEG